MAAAHCLGLMAEHFAHRTVAELCVAAGLAYPPPPPPTQREADSSNSPTDGMHALRLGAFDVRKVVEQGTPLLASGGEEYESEDSSSAAGSSVQSRADYLARQKANLKKRMGMGSGLDDLMDTSGACVQVDTHISGHSPLRFPMNRTHNTTLLTMDTPPQ